MGAPEESKESKAPRMPRLGAADRDTLLQWSARDSGPLCLRSRIVLACAEGHSTRQIAQRLGVSPATVAKWRQRFLAHGPAGLSDARRSGRPRSPGRQDAERRVAAVLDLAHEGEPVPSTRDLSEELGLSQSTVARIRQEQAGRRTASSAASGPVPGPARMAPDTPLPRQLLSDHVYARLRDWIVSGELVPGQRVVESEIARRMGTSQAPAREAIKRLAHEGLVNSLPRQGTYVTQVSDRQARDVREIRVMFEMYAARRATGRLDAECLRRLAEDIDAMRRAADDGDIGDFRDADMSFHRTVCTAAGNAALLRLWHIIEPSMWGLHVLGNPRYRGDWRAMAELHAELLAALRDGDPDETAALFAAHAAGEASRYRRGHLPS
ncbi:helix-turn-helix domain-containing protein [Streptomyces sp. FXJ1.4098]|uniref:helix-turn-helix domain-containing protein n=1 Tax=Streptomyces sp. NPDC020845 TaxID=3365096 RepID=UPI00299C9D89|nr:helix-turn-helix domain-containing protein [Streptomyces sp. FXJ1.4098]